MMRRSTFLLPVFLTLLIGGCSRSSESGAPGAKFLAQGKIGGLTITDVKLAPSLPVSTQETAEKLDAGLRPANPADSRNVVLELIIISDTADGSWQPFPCGQFVLTYDGGSAPCVGISLGDQWVLATGGSPEMKLIYHEPGETREEKLLFLVPKSAGAATLELKSAGGPPVQLARVTLP